MNRRRLVFTPQAERQWRDLTPEVRRAIEERLERFALDGHGDVRKLSGRPGWRLRVGKWRVLFLYEQPDTIAVFKVDDRKDVY